jgi:hypothetical protein
MIATRPDDAFWQLTGDFPVSIGRSLKTLQEIFP